MRLYTKYGRAFMVYEDGRIQRMPFMDRRRVKHPAKFLAHSAGGGYPCVYGAVDGVRFGLAVHRLLAECYLPRIRGADQVNHKDGDKTNFALSNLEWVTAQQNTRHAIDAGLTVPPAIGPGELSRAAKLTEQQVRVIKRRLLDGETYRQIATDYGVCAGTIGHIKYGKTWVEVGAA